MCGIAGLLGVAPELANDAASRMLAALRHRGPDDVGIEAVPDPRGLAPPAVLVQARLAILDLSPAGHQPKPDRPPDGRPSNWVNFNGEIFNYLELHPELARAGWPCRSTSDTEAILHAYRAWGEDCVRRMRGMFAWCLLDAEQGAAWFCRDRLGIKPLYLARPASGGLIFASEVRALLAAGPELVPPRVNPRAIEGFLAQGAVWGLDSVIDGVTMLGPGQTLTTDWSGRERDRRTYWQVDFGDPGSFAARDGRGDRAEAVERLGATLRDAVRLRLISDVPLGLFLSGGIDSASLVTVATEVAGSQVETISIGFDQPEFDETEAAAGVARALGTNHRALRLTGQTVLDDLPAVLDAVDQPTVDGVNVYFVSREARRAGLTVALSGLGGDELFGGYASFADAPKAVRLRRRLRWAESLTPVLAGAARMTGGRRGVKAAELFRREASLLPMYLLRRELFLPGERRLLHDLPEGADPACGLPPELIDDLERRAAGAEPVNRVSLFELSTYMRHMLLRDADVFSMAHGLELRVPLIDHVLVEQAVGLPGAWKRPDPRPKPLLVDAVGPRLPRSVYNTPKRGFTFPWDAWLRGPLRARAADAMTDRATWADLGLDPAAPAGLWDRFLRRDPSVAALQVLGLLVLGHYARRHRLSRVA
jgi:asparagine synthase (glutamine-hydrolysing)